MVLPRNPAVYTTALEAELLISRSEFRRIGRVFASVLEGRSVNSASEYVDFFPPLPAAQLAGRRNSAFVTTDDLLLLLFEYHLRGRTEEELATQYDRTQACVSQWLTRAYPYWRVVLHHFCLVGHKPNVRLASKLMHRSAPLRAQYLELRKLRGPVYGSFQQGEKLPVWPYKWQKHSEPER